MAYNRTVTITGLDEVLKSLSAYADKLKESTAEALVAEASDIMADSKTNYVPVDLGGLRDSGKVAPIEQDGDRASVTIYYDAPYAAAIHENPRAGKTGGWPTDPQDPPLFRWVTKGGKRWLAPIGAQRKSWASTGGWKYLELAVLAAEPGMLSRIANRIRSAVGGRIAAGGA